MQYTWPCRPSPTNTRAQLIEAQALDLSGFSITIKLGALPLQLDHGVALKAECHRLNFAWCRFFMWLESPCTPIPMFVGQAVLVKDSGVSAAWHWKELSDLSISVQYQYAACLIRSHSHSDHRFCANDYDNDNGLNGCSTGGSQSMIEQSKSHTTYCI